MSTRLLYFFSGIACLLAAYLYFNQDKISTKHGSGQERFDYWANDVRAIQTNLSGQADFEITAKSLTHDPKTDLLVLSDLSAQMKYVGNDKAVFHFLANEATWQQSLYLLELKGDVNVTRQPDLNVSADDQISINTMSNPQLAFTTESLQANTKTKMLVGNKPIQMIMNNSSIHANAMRADLNRGEYQFDKLRAKYVQ